MTRLINNFFPIKSKLAVIIFASAILFTLLSVCIEFIFGVPSCFFCKLQRSVYVALLIPSFIWMVSDYKRVQIVLAVQFLFVCGASFALYHFLMQIGVLSDFCAVPKITSMEHFENLLNKKTCSEISWKLFGAPITIYNFIFSLVSLVFLQKWKIRNRNYSLQFKR